MDDDQHIDRWRQRLEAPGAHATVDSFMVVHALIS